MDRDLPRGTVTFLFTDIEGSTRLLKRLGDRYADVLRDHGDLLRVACEASGGREIDTQGDSFLFAFARAKDGVVAAVEGQRRLVANRWPDGVKVRVRMGLHTGEPLVGDDRYVGLGVHKAARVGAAAHGGQILLSNATRELVEDELPPGFRLVDLGEHGLKDIDRPERIFQVSAQGLGRRFGPLRVVPTPRSRPHRPSRKRAIVGVAGTLALAGLAAGLVLGLANGTKEAPIASAGGTKHPMSPGRDPDTIVFGRSIGAVELGMSEAEVRRRYAGGEEGQWLASGRNGTRLVYSGMGGGLTVSFYEGRVVQVTTTNSYYVTANGIRVGAIISAPDRPKTGVTAWRGFVYQGQRSWCLLGEHAATQLVQGPVSIHISNILITDARLLPYLPAHTDPNPYTGGVDAYCSPKPL